MITLVHKVLQVGDAGKDHACWERPEDMDTPRSVIKIDKNTPGTEVAAETAAALAAASLVFRRSDPNYSKVLARRAIRVFEFADKHRAAYSVGLRRYVCPYYCDFSGYQDELLWGAAWLHRATRNPTYLSYIQANGQTLGADEIDNTFGWDNKHVGARILLSKAYLVQNVQPLHDYKSHADNFICSLLPGTPYSSAQYTPGGLLFKMNDSNMQYVTSTSFLLVTYAKYLTTSRRVVNCGGAIIRMLSLWDNDKLRKCCVKLQDALKHNDKFDIDAEDLYSELQVLQMCLPSETKSLGPALAIITPKKLRAFAKNQVDYLLGDNPMKMSFMVGYGSRYPVRIHHRGSSLPSVNAQVQIHHLSLHPQS
ncbi:endoglucanase 3-like, partial [Salvia miltiorrhiza]|uniref:endoglucanase 3-like n=1 Tax=Salvia miltiorrhiza TaxID=226208 RepID=UPI0025AD7FF2